MRPCDRGQNHEYHCKSVRLETPALLSKNKLSSVKIISLETKLLSSNLLSSLLIALRKFWPKLHYLVHSDEDRVFPGAFLKYYHWPVRDKFLRDLWSFNFVFKITMSENT